jgi:lipopolysaccharide/colanic/teichoic acid biosynthesis glycosyltransferase
VSTEQYAPWVEGGADRKSTGPPKPAQLAARAEVRRVGAAPVVSRCRGVVSPRWVTRATKRSFDVVVAAVVLVLAAPLLAIVAALIVIDSPGPVFHRVERVGFRGRPLRMLKFRKMAVGAHGVALTTNGDARLTRVGALLACTRLDELPQLWHVLRGDMSLVGPRPEHLGFVARHPSAYRLILSVRPGLTGLSQLAYAEERAVLDATDPLGHYLRGILPQKVVLDCFYARHVGVAMDLRILAATARTLFLRQPIAVDRGSARLTLRRRPEADGTG